MASYTYFHKIRVNSSTLIQDFIDLSGVSIKRELEDNQIFDRASLTGTITFFSTSYDILYNLMTGGDITATLQILNQYGTTEANGFIDLQGEYDEKKKVCKLKVFNDDKYTKLLKDYDVKKNVFEYDIDNTSIFIDFERLKLEFSQTKFTENDGLGSLWYDRGVPLISGAANFVLYARQSYTATATEVSVLTGRDGWELKDSTSNTLIRDWVGIYDQINVLDESTYFVLSPVFPGTPPTINDQFPDSTLYLSRFTEAGNQSGGVNIRYIRLKNDVYYGSGNVMYSSAKSLKDIIEEIVTDIDNTVNFDVDSFGAFDSGYTGLDDLFMIPLPDFILTELGTAKTYPSVYSEISLQTIFDFLRDRFGIFWYLDASNNFRLEFFKDITYSVSTLPAHNLTTYQSINWSEDNFAYNIDNKDKADRWRYEDSAGNLDFIGTDVVFTNVENKNTKIISNTQIFVDVNDIINSGSKYSDNSRDQFVLITADDYSTENLLQFFTNRADADFAVSSANGKNLALSEVVVLDDLIDIDASGTALAVAELISNEFAGNNGDTFTVNITIANSSADIRISLIVAEDYEVGKIEYNNSTKGDGTHAITFTNVNYVSSPKYRLLLRFPIANTAIDITSIEVLNSNCYNIRKGTGAFSGKLNVQNVELSVANCVNNEYLARIPDTAATANGTTYNFSTDVIDKFRKLDTIQTVSNNVATDFNFFDKVITDISSDCQIESIEKKLTSNIVEVKLKF
jgi:hypothetical protein